MKKHPTHNGRPIRRSTFGHAASYDAYLVVARFAMRAAELAAVDWLIHRRKANPYRPGSPAHGAYDRAFNREQLADPHPNFHPIPDLPRARQRNSAHHNEEIPHLRDF